MRPGFKERVSHPSASPLAVIDTSSSDRPDLGGVGKESENDDNELPESLIKLFQFANFTSDKDSVGGICHLLDDSVISRIGVDAVRQWHIDQGSRDHWMQQAERSLSIAAQESDDDGGGE